MDRGRAVPADTASGDGVTAREGSAPSARRSPARIGGLVLAAVVLLALTGSLYVRARLRASLPQLEGRRVLVGLRAPVRIERDALGVPTILGANRPDVARATGFLHGQDRFFQMDLLRRRAAGELAEIVGRVAVRLDREIRVHRFRSVAERVVGAGSPEERTLVQAYAEGVNAGLAALGGKPFEYLALGVDPAPWRPEDSVLAALAMFATLQDPKGGRESDLGLMHDLLPAPVFEFLAPRGTEWDTPDVGGALPGAPLPGPEALDLRSRDPFGRLPTEAAGDPEPEHLPGSNNWAVAGRLTAHGGALLANDMHLGIAVPNTWYRASLSWPGSDGETHRITGVTLPGTPAVVVGSNTHVAWGFTNTEGDWSDLVEIEADPRDQDAYLTPAGPRKLERARERIRVKGGAEETLEVVSTVWGPIVDHDHRGRPRALRWVAHDVEAVNFGLARLETARSLDEALDLAGRVGIPAQNFVCVDASGRIGWTVIGVMPRRVGFDGRLPGSWADGGRRWDGWLTPGEHPRLVDPPSGRLWTANQRVVDGRMAELIGESFYDLGARARQIRDDLFALDKPRELDMLRIQLDDRALFLARWRDLLLRTLSAEAVALSPRRAEMRRLVEAWGGHASVDSVGYRLVRAFRSSLAEQVLGALLAPCRRADPRFDLKRIPRIEGPLWALVTEKPPHLLSPRYPTWDAQLLAAVDVALEDVRRDGSDLAQRTWGERNTARVQHPLGRVVPLLGRFLDMPREPLPGDSHMPRFQSPEAGASERMVVSPGREKEGFFHMPGGQSGHPLSPHYGDGHAAWVRGEPTPFLPGPAVQVLILEPWPRSPTSLKPAGSP
jgi:penicillin amidase